MLHPAWPNLQLCICVIILLHHHKDALTHKGREVVMVIYADLSAHQVPLTLSPLGVTTVNNGIADTLKNQRNRK